MPGHPAAHPSAPAGIDQDHPPETGNAPDLPPEFDTAIYTAYPDHRDVRHFDEAAARAHYDVFGRAEGRVCSAVGDRADFLALVPKDADLLEIGPFCTPAFTRADRPGLRYLDALTTEQLRARAAGMAWADPSRVPEIDHVWTGEPYATLTRRRFDAVYSSHTIEHMPCLIKHLREVGSILRPGGRYFLTIPDKRYCFDHFLPETTIADVVEAFLVNRTNRHSPRSLIEQALYHTHNDAGCHWQGDHWSNPLERPVTTETLSMLQGAIDDWTRGDRYIDAHAWKFTPTAFRNQIDILSRGNVIPLVPERVYDTLHLRGEFYAVLRAGAANPEPSRAA